MRHPHLRAFLKAFEEWIVKVDGLQMGTSVLTAVGLLHLATQGMRDELRSITDAQHGHTTYELAQVYLEGLGIVDAIGRTAENHAYHRGVVLRKLVVGHNLAKGVQLAHPAANELRGLRAEVENNNLLHHINLRFDNLLFIEVIYNLTNLSAASSESSFPTSSTFRSSLGSPTMRERWQTLR